MKGLSVSMPQFPLLKLTKCSAVVETEVLARELCAHCVRHLLLLTFSCCHSTLPPCDYHSGKKPVIYQKLPSGFISADSRKQKVEQPLNRCVSNDATDPPISQ